MVVDNIVLLLTQPIGDNMDKQVVKIKLFGITESGSKAQTPEDIVFFGDLNKTAGVFTKVKGHSNCVGLRTAKANYKLVKHATLGYYHGICNGVPVRVCLGQTIGELRYYV